jgi:hypothetical protein
MENQLNIQGSSGIISYQPTDRVGIAKKTGTSTQSTSGASSSSTKVSLSAAALSFASQDTVATQGRTALQQKLIDSAAADPQWAEKVAEGFANVRSQIAYDISDQLAAGTCGPVNKLASTGRIIDDAFKENFYNEASRVDAQKKEIYATEKAKGTPAAEIYAKLIDFTNTQSSDYLECTGWCAKATD